MAKEWILNSATNRFQLNFKRNVGATSEAIRKCAPKSLAEWQEYYFANVKSQEHIIELGKKLYVKITEVLVAEIDEITEEDCINYIKELVIDRTYDGYVREIKTIYEQLQDILEVKITPAPDEWDRLFNVDFYIQVNDKYIGLQIKPVSQVSSIESSTATGFIMEEFIVSKLETYSQSHNNIDDIRIERIENQRTQKTSYDCFVNYQDVFFMINVKVDKRNNNAVSAINILHNDYICKNPEQEKSFLVLKTRYAFGESKKNQERKILVQGISIYALEEVDFTIGHKQDHRNWSKTFNPASGRLQISKKFRELNALNEEDISYSKTKQFIEKMYTAQ